MYHVLYLVLRLLEGLHLQGQRQLSHDRVDVLTVRAHPPHVVDEIIHDHDHVHLELRLNGVTHRTVSVSCVSNLVIWHEIAQRKYVPQLLH